MTKYITLIMYNIMYINTTPKYNTNHVSIYVYKHGRAWGNLGDPISISPPLDCKHIYINDEY